MVADKINPAWRRLKNHLTLAFVISHVLTPLAVLLFYLALASRLLPAGVNKVFATRLFDYLLPVMVVLLIGLAAILLLQRRRPPLQPAAPDPPSAGDLILILLPLTPVLQYVLNNQDILSWAESAQILGFFALFAALPVLAIPLLLRKTGAQRALTSLGAAFTFTLTNMALLSGQFAWFEYGSLKIQLPVFAGLWVLCWLAFELRLRRVLYALVLIFFLANTVFQLLPRSGPLPAAAGDAAASRLPDLVEGRQPAAAPNIYLLVYDSYVAREVMAAYGIDNLAQEQFMRELGFKLYPHTYSVGGESLDSMGTVLNVSAGSNADLRRWASGEGAVLRLLQGLGYKTYGVFGSDYFFRGNIPRYDVSFPAHGSEASLLIKAILMGEFRFDVNFDVIDTGQFLQERQKSFADPARPKMIYTHVSLPGHSQNSGACLPDETERYRQRLADANQIMRADLKWIVANDPAAIVIVAGDHGPYLTKNCWITEGYDVSEIDRLDIQDRFGAFLAIRWPTPEFEAYDEITVLQDIFPAIFAYLFEDAGILESKIDPNIINKDYISGASVLDGVIEGGVNAGEPLFVGSTAE